MLYIRGVNQPKLTTGRQAVTSLGKGNPMKDHARHVPGSIRSRRTAFSRSVPFFLPSLLSPVRSEKCDHYASKMRPNLKTQILINSLPTTYNFELKKWSHFPATERFPLPWGEGQGEGQTGSLFSVGSSHHPFSLGEKVRMRDKPALRSRSPHVATTLQHCTESSKSANSSIFDRIDHAVPSTYAKENRRTPIAKTIFRKKPKFSGIR